MEYLSGFFNLKTYPPTPKGGVPLSKHKKYSKMHNFGIFRAELPLWG
jgi:hypothetical protein